MRSTLLSSLVVFGLSASRALANAICTPKHDLGITTEKLNQYLETTKDCIGKICPGDAESFVTKQCGSVLLTINRTDASLPHTANCASHFSSIVDQCFITEGGQGGTILTEHALFEIHVTDRVSGAQGGSLLEDGARNSTFEGRNGRGNRTRLRRGAKWARGKAKPKSTSKGSAKEKPQPKPEEPAKEKPKPKPEQTTTEKPKPKPEQKAKDKPKETAKEKSKPKPDETQSCQKTKKTGKKTARDVLDDFLPQILRRATPSKSTGPAPATTSPNSCEPDISNYYKRENLNRKKVTHWRFQTKKGWQKAVGNGKMAQKHRRVMAKMHDNGKLDVVRLAKGRASVVGDPAGPSNPKNFARKTGNYILSNANFFVVRGTKGLTFDVPGEPLDSIKYGNYAVGPTSSTKNYIDIPSVHKKYYAKFQGDDGTNLWSGPELRSKLDLSKPELCYFEAGTTTRSPYTRIPGGVATSNQANERLVTAILNDGSRYLFAYTSKRKEGMNLNDMRELIDTFLRQYYSIPITSAKQVLNLDGGQSIYVSWNSGGKETVIAKGGQLDRVSGRSRVLSLLKISV